MKASVGRRGAFAVTAALAAVVTVAGCQGDDGGSKAAGSAKPKAAQGTVNSPAEAVTAAYEKLSDYKSAKFTMEMGMPATAGTAGTTGPTTMKASGTLGWSPAVMDMTMDTSALGAGAPGRMRELMVGTTMYMDFSSEIKSEPQLGEALGGKRWLKMDLAAMAKQAPGGGQATSDLVNSSFQNQQNPAQQLASLLQAPQISRVGAETVDGVKTQHYKGHLTIDEALKSSSAVKGLSAADRKQLGDSMKQAGVTAENLDVWVGGDSFPVRMDIAMDTSAGRITIREHLSDFSAKAASVPTPPAGQTFTLEEMMKQIQGGATS
ncbi:hypothetical protein [Streptomyces fuscigenes]|uniref:hypothetical protein n=1 Tax=Streptomyces fuscigenes TaxID=1528880 RepID=UPI001F334843|nr:hypothetical protein [Streptomyces fuscigenes]MCF3961929.1 hypothetical protein [Streptomyces fuscigenes]